MGALCGKESRSDDPFSQPGRAVGSAPPPQSRASVPKVSGQGQTLGGGSASAGGSTSGGDARTAAAKAAEERAKKANQPKGKLGRDLAAQKGKTRVETLEAHSAEARRKAESDKQQDILNQN